MKKILIVLIIFSFYFYAIQGAKRNENVKLFLGKDIVHRGAFTSEIPENSMKSFEKAIEKDFIIELDILLTKDKEVIVFHDDNLKRLTGVDRNVDEMTIDEITNLKIKDTDENIPTLEEVLKLVNGRVPIIIDVKSGNASDIEIVKKANEILKNYNGEYAIQSFNPFVLRWVKNNSPDTVRIQLSSDFLGEEGNNVEWFKKLLLQHMLLNFISKPNIIAYKINSRGNLSLSLLRGTLPIIFWTVRDENEMNYARENANNIIFDYNMFFVD